MMENNFLTKINQLSFNIIPTGYDLFLLAFFSETLKRLVIREPFNSYLESLFNWVSKYSQREEITKLLGDDGIWFEVEIGVGVGKNK